MIGPDEIEWETRAARIGEEWTTTPYIVDYPDYPSDGYLSELFELTDVGFDLALVANVVSDFERLHCRGASMN